MKSIKIYTKCQLVLLRNINPFLGRYKLPRRVLRKIDYILEAETLGRQGFIVVILSPVKDDIREIEDAVNVYPLEAKFDNDLDYEDVLKHSGDVAKGKEWFLDKLSIQGTDSQIYVLFSIKKKHLDENCL
ncbi:MAG: hypothetical protein NC420_07720 [Eubacterium sp.]|nr:hypothetical protein [Eubacterium sp.]